MVIFPQSKKKGGLYLDIINSNVPIHLVLFVGTKKLVKRKEFEEFISGRLVI